VTVKAVEPGGRCLKAGMADERGKFVIRGMADGPATLTILAGHIKEKTRVPLVLAGDRTDLKISLQSIPFPKDLKTYRVLGMELADVTPELRSAYDLATDRGVLILACVKRTDPMQQPGEISPGCLLREVEIGSGNSVRDVRMSTPPPISDHAAGRTRIGRRAIDSGWALGYAMLSNRSSILPTTSNLTIAWW